MAIGEILIVDDNELSAQALAQAVKELGYSVCSVSPNTKKAIEDFNSFEPTVVLIDFNLGEGLDGIDLMVEIEKIRNVPVVLVTSDDSDEDIEKILRKKPDAYIQKPVEVKELRAILELVTFKFQKEKEMEEINRELERRVKERTEELNVALKSLTKEMEAKEKLHKKLEKSLTVEKHFGDLKSNIITNLSHEFKTPLASIRSSAQILDRFISTTSNDERGLKHTARIEEGVDILTHLLTRILSVEKDQESFYQPDKIKIHLPTYLDNLKEEFDDTTQYEAVITSDINLHDDYIYTDPKLLRLILINVVSNACKYSHANGEVNVQITSNGTVLHMVVRDFGIGIDNEDLEQIYYRFFRGKNVESIEGTGIGLSIVKRCLNALFGEIEVESELNKGTTVSIKIPIIQPEAD